MSKLGLGVMIGMLAGNEDSVNAFNSCVGKTIKGIDLNEERILFTFQDDTKMKLFDDGQSCCEYRYLHTDDDLQSFVGTVLISAEVLEGPEIEGKYGDIHEQAFLHVKTNEGVFTVETHNEHNGYYGGFLIRAAIVD